MIELSKESIMYLVNNLSNEFNTEVTCDEVINIKSLGSTTYIFTIKNTCIALHNDPYSNKSFYIGDARSIKEILEAMKTELKKKIG